MGERGGATIRCFFSSPIYVPRYYIYLSFYILFSANNDTRQPMRGGRGL